MVLSGPATARAKLEANRNKNNANKPLKRNFPDPQGDATRPKPVQDARTGVKRGMATRSGALFKMQERLNSLTKQEDNALTDAQRNPDKTNKATLKKASAKRGEAARDLTQLLNQLKSEADRGNTIAAKEVAKYQEVSTKGSPRRPVAKAVKDTLGLKRGGLPKKPKMSGTGSYKGKKHSYAAGGMVKELKM